MNPTNYQHIIQKCKRFPKQGAIGWGSWTSKLREVADDLETQMAGTDAQLQRTIGFTSTLQTAMAEGLVKLAQQFSFLEQRNKVLNSTLGMTSRQAGDLGHHIDLIVQTMQIGGETARIFAASLGKSLVPGFMTSELAAKSFGSQLLRAQAYMRDNLGVSEQAALGFELYAQGMERSGIDQLGSTSSVLKNMEEQLGMAGLQRDITEEIGNLANNLQIQYGRMPGKLELAILKSRSLGLSMKELSATANNLLNIESSVGQELEYQLLTGRRLVGDKETAGDLAGKSLTNEYRIATMQGDANKQAEIMNQILMQEGETLKNNMFARQQMSKLLGIDETTLAKSLQKRQLLANLGKEELMNLNAEDFETELAKLKTEVADDPDRKALYKKLVETTDIRTSDERIADAVEQLTAVIAADEARKAGKTQGEIISSASEGFNNLILDGAKSVAGIIAPIFDQPAISGFIGAAATWQSAITYIYGVGSALKSYFTTGGANQPSAVAPYIAPTTGTGPASPGVKDGLITIDKNDNALILGTNKEGNASLAESVETYAASKNSSTMFSSENMNQLAMTLSKALNQLSVNVSVDKGIGEGSSMNNPRFNRRIS